MTVLAKIIPLPQTAEKSIASKFRACDNVSSENYSYNSQWTQGFSFWTGIFSLDVGVGHVVKAQVIGSACPGLGSNVVRHAAFATIKQSRQTEISPVERLRVGLAAHVWSLIKKISLT